MRIKIEEPKLIQKFLTTLDKINQDIKNIHNFDGIYNIEEGKIYCSTNGEQIPRIVTGEYSSHSSTKLVNEFFNERKFTVDAPRYFEFRKSKKDPVEFIEIVDREYIKIQTTHLKEVYMVEYDEGILLSDEFSIAEVDLRNPTSSQKVSLLASNVTLNEECFEDLSKIRGSGSIKRYVLNTDDMTSKEVNYYSDVLSYNENEFLVETSKKYIVGFGKNTQSVKYNVYSVEADDLILVETILDNKFLTIKQCDVYIDLRGL